MVELFEKAVALAASATNAYKAEDLKYAFTGQARSAFIWLQSFLSSEKERAWCYTKGCPACVVDHSLDSMFSIGLLYAACLLSDVHYPFTIEGPTLPSFMFFLDSLERALIADLLWDSALFELTHPKAITTRNGVEELIQQCLELDAILSRSSSPCSTPVSSASSSPLMSPSRASPSAGRANLKVKRSKMARQQMKLQIEGNQLMEKMLKNCWDQLQPAVQGGLMTPVPAQELDTALKREPVVAVKEVDDEG